MDLGLKGRVAVVGGGSRGLGKACALSLAHEGANVAICSRGVESLEAAAKEIRSTTGAEVLAVPAVARSTVSGLAMVTAPAVDTTLPAAPAAMT